MQINQQADPPEQQNSNLPPGSCRALACGFAQHVAQLAQLFNNGP